jgi:nucleoside-diphosphate-sugar epimerase
MTGDTGFVGQRVLADLLERENILRVFVLRRDRKRRFLVERTDDRVTVIKGDIELPRCGLSVGDDAMLLAAGITRVLHCAASVQFHLSLENIARINIHGSLRVQELAESWSATCRRMVHLSTAFVWPPPKELHPPVYEERLVDLGVYDPRMLYQSMVGEISPRLAVDAMKWTGHVNHYTFTKCVAEHLLLRRRKKVPVVIIRPDIVGPSWMHPFPGWYGGGVGSPISSAIQLRYHNIIRVMPVSRHPTPFIPVDVLSCLVVRSCLESSVETIVHAAWDVNVSPRSVFTPYRMYQLYYDYAVAHGILSSWTAGFFRCILYVTEQVPSIFPVLHFLFNEVPSWPLVLVARHKIRKLLRIPMDYRPFVFQPYRFRSSLTCPESLDGDEYITRAIDAVVSHQTSARGGR